MKTLGIVVLGALALLAAAARAERPHMDLLVLQDHRSDLFKGAGETTEDYFGVGVTVRWRKFEVDVSQGVNTRDCGLIYRERCRWEQGTRLSTRWYPLRGRGRHQ